MALDNQQYATLPCLQNQILHHKEYQLRKVVNNKTEESIRLQSLKYDILLLPDMSSR